MPAIDRSSPVPVADQLVEQIRYRIASGRMRAGDALPSTRAAGSLWGVSFHTVRKAYQVLEREGLVGSRPGSGYVILGAQPLGKAERIERGAQLIGQTLQQLVGYGLSETEIESVFNEQLELLSDSGASLKVVFAAPSLELAELLAKQVERVLQQEVDAVAFGAVGAGLDADVLIGPSSHFRILLDQAPRVDALSAASTLNPDAIERAARLLPHHTIGVVTRDGSSIEPLVSDLRHHSGFEGAILAASIEDSAYRVEDLARQVDLLLCTPACRRRITGTAAEKTQIVQLWPVIATASLEAIAEAVPKPF